MLISFIFAPTSAICWAPKNLVTRVDQSSLKLINTELESNFIEQLVIRSLLNKIHEYTFANFRVKGDLQEPFLEIVVWEEDQISNKLELPFKIFLVFFFVWVTNLLEIP